MAHGKDMRGKMVFHKEVMLPELIAVLEGTVETLDRARNNPPKYHLGVEITGDLCRGEHKLLEYEGSALDAHYGDRIRAHVLNARSISGRQPARIETFAPVPLENRLYVPVLKIESLDESGRAVKTYGHIPEEKVIILE